MDLCKVPLNIATATFLSFSTPTFTDFKGLLAILLKIIKSPPGLWQFAPKVRGWQDLFWVPINIATY